MKSLALNFILMLSYISFAASATIQIQSNSLGNTITVPASGDLPSLSLNLWIPKTNEKTQFPVLVVLDGQRYFNYAVSMHDLIQNYGWAPPFAILGLETSEKRWSTLMGSRQEILEVLEAKVLPYIEKSYPLSQERILFGWEAAGGFTLKTFIDKPDLFNGYIAASPSPLYGEYFPTLHAEHLAMVEAMTKKGSGKHLYVAQGRYDYPQYLGISELKNALDNSKGNKPRYRFESISDATHSDLGFEALLRGMRDYFYFFDKPQFQSLQDFEKAGGIEYLDLYFKEQEQLYGLTKEEVEKNRFELLRKLSFMPIMDGDLKAFNDYFNLIRSTNFLTLSHANHIYRYGLFRLQQGDTDGATELFQYINAREPENALPINGLGLVAKVKNEKSKARDFFEKAVMMAEKNQDFRIQEYRNNLQQLD